ncbi:MAG: DUF6338 family protein [Candidatus Binataceae bacterium]
MLETHEALTVLIFLLPGFLSERLADALTIRPQRSAAMEVVEALIFSLLVYLLYSIVGFVVGLPPIVSLVGAIGTITASGQSIWGVAVLVIGALVLAAAQAIVVNYEWFDWFAYNTGLTKRLTTWSVWLDTFGTFRGVWIRVHLENGDRIVGWPRFYSENTAEPELFLADSYIEGTNGAVTNVDGPGILLTPTAKIAMIELLK